MKPSETTVALVSLLGGPKLNAEDIEWASELPAGEKLLNWLVSQVQLELPPLDTDADSDSLRAALQAIALEEDEVDALRHATRKATSASRPTMAQISSEYFPPWKRRPQEEHTAAEATLLERETEVLKSRIHQTKLASQSLSKAIKFIASEIERTNNDIVAAQDSLSELSLSADAAIVASVDNSFAALDVLVPDNGAIQGTYYSIPRNLTSLSSGSADESPHAATSAASAVSSTVADRFQSQMQAIDALASRVPCAAEVQAEGARLDATLNKPRAEGKTLVSLAADAAFNLEVVRLCEKLEDPGTGRDALASMIAEKPEQSSRLTAVDVKAELEHAWALDQAAVLDARGAVLDETIAALSTALMPPLKALHEELSATDAHMREAQALISALREEIGDIVDDARAAKQPHELSDDAGDAEQTKDEQLQASLTQLLMQLKDLRPQDAPPLVLLNQEDILNELRSVYDQDEKSRRQEEAWVAGLLPTLRDLETAHAPLLDAIYANSPMNSSPPFAFPDDIQRVQADAKVKAEDLEGAVAKLQEDRRM
ncbi:hypothetical protein C8R43DRAFT_187702 [Mycena crocata]|nr:hypothetical protein C8R43DRAFT_187702 [Mycena crocata]